MGDVQKTESKDCTGCKLVGTGGCFAGAVYAIYQRSQLPATNKNRKWLTVIAVGKVIEHTLGES